MFPLTQGGVLAQTFAQLIPWIVAGAFLPTWTSYVTLLLGTQRPMKTSSAYVLGNATWRLALGFTALFIVSVAAPHAESRGIRMPTWFAWALAALLCGMGFWLITRKPKADSSQPESIPRWLRTLKRLPPWAAFGYAIYNCALPGAQWVYFLGGIAVIAASGLSAESEFTLLVVFVMLLETMLVTPIVIYYRKRERAQVTFDRMDVWLGRHATTVFGGILVMIGGLFVWIALNGGHVGGVG